MTVSPFLSTSGGSWFRCDRRRGLERRSWLLCWCRGKEAAEAREPPRRQEVVAVRAGRAARKPRQRSRRRRQHRPVDAWSFVPSSVVGDPSKTAGAPDKFPGANSASTSYKDVAAAVADCVGGALVSRKIEAIAGLTHLASLSLPKVSPEPVARTRRVETASTGTVVQNRQTQQFCRGCLSPLALWRLLSPPAWRG